MASVFLSYDRDDSDRARHFARVLEQAGHEVWWDLHVRGGAQFSKVIEEALKAADVVVVLWSANAIESAWVRDEASAGRDTGRLVPVTVDGAEPPLGFRQFQTIDLSRWKGRGTPAELRTLLADVDTTARSPEAGAPIRISKLRPEIPWRAIGLVAVGSLLGLGALAWNYLDNPHSAPVVAIASADDAASSKALSRDLLVKLGSLQSAQTGEAMRLVGPDSQDRPTLMLTVSQTGTASRADATVAVLNGKDHSLLWSKDFSRPSTELADLKQEAAYTAGQVLSCAIDGLPTRGPRISQESLKLYLKGCAAYTDTSGDNLLQLVPLFRKLTQAEPKFDDGWAKLLLIESAFPRMSYIPESAGIIGSLPQDIAAARRLNPNLPEALLAEAALLPDNAFRRRLALLERAAEQGPDNAPVLSVLSDNLLMVGRMNDGIEQAQRAVRANPLSPAARESLIAALTSSGKIDEALAELRRSEQLWPGASGVLGARYRIYLRYGDANEALKLIRSGAVSTSNTPYVDSFVKARADPTAANIEKAVREARSFYDRLPTSIYHFEQVLGTFGREDELFPILLNWRFPDKVTYVADGLFRPALRNFRRDRRMMAVAKRLSLLDYWRDTGHWPDFCFEPDLPYDCRKEAAKLT